MNPCCLCNFYFNLTPGLLKFKLWPYIFLRKGHGLQAISCVSVTMNTHTCSRRLIMLASTPKLDCLHLHSVLYTVPHPDGNSNLRWLASSCFTFKYTYKLGAKEVHLQGYHLKWLSFCCLSFTLVISTALDPQSSIVQDSTDPRLITD